MPLDTTFKNLTQNYMVCTVPRLAELLPRGSSSDRISETSEMKKKINCIQMGGKCTLKS